MCGGGHVGCVRFQATAFASLAQHRPSCRPHGGVVLLAPGVGPLARPSWSRRLPSSPCREGGCYGSPLPGSRTLPLMQGTEGVSSCRVGHWSKDGLPHACPATIPPSDMPTPPARAWLSCVAHRRVGVAPARACIIAKWVAAATEARSSSSTPPAAALPLPEAAVPGDDEQGFNTTEDLRSDLDALLGAPLSPGPTVSHGGGAYVDRALGETTLPIADLMNGAPSQVGGISADHATGEGDGLPRECSCERWSPGRCCL